jgi:4-hydroxy-tetrahydrodipicolinate reductase
MPRMPSIRVLHVGLGPIGSAIARQVVSRRGLIPVGAVDVDPAKVGRDMSNVIGVERRLGVPVQADLAKAIRSTRPDVVLHCTSSSLKAVMPQLTAILDRRVPIVSTTEELSYPFFSNRRFAKELDARARRAKVAVVGTGVNPGFAMDALPIMLTAVCERVDRITVTRIQDARIRRLPFQLKIGSGLTRAQFAKKVADRSVRHVGLTESIAMIADALAWKLDRITDDIAPRIAARTVESEYLAVDRGYVCGIVQDGVGYRGGEPVIRLHMEAYLGAPETYDAIEIDGSPKLSVRFEGGIHGDIATTSIAVNSIPKVLTAQPGLHTMRDLELPSFFAAASAGRTRARS